MAEDSIILARKINRKNSLEFKKLLTWQGWQTAGLIFGFYTFLTLLFFPQIYFYSLERNDFSNLLVAIGRLSLANYLWAAQTPLVFWLGNRMPVERPGLIRKLTVHVIFGLILGAFQTIAYHYLLGFFYERSAADITKSLFTSWGVFLNNVTNGFIFYVGILAFNQAVNYSRKYRDREFRLQQAELKALKTQLHPHFLFNTLNAISALVYVSPPTATKTISQLSDLLRLTLHNNKAQEVTLKEELDFLRKYIQIQQTLLQERLEVEWSVDSETLDALVPNMLLQPLVENSIRHGIAPKEDGGRIEIFSRRVNNDLLLEIKDNGLGTESEESEGNGIGLINTKARLKHLYGDAQKIDVNTPECDGWCVTIMIPYREQKEIHL